MPASTINDLPYYFQRASALSPTADWTEIPRNRELLRYLRALSGKPIPGFGEALVSKTTPADRDQLLVAMMDYIRSINLYDDNLSSSTFGTQSAANSALQFTTGRATSNASVTPVWSGHGVVAPLRVPAELANSSAYPPQPDKTSLMGFGRYHTISDAALLFICSGDGSAGTNASPIGGNTPAEVAKRLSNDVAKNSALAGTKLNEDERLVQALLFFDLFSVMQGWTQYGMTGSFDVEWTGDFTLNGTTLGFSGGQTAYLDSAGVVNMCHPWGGSIGIRRPLHDHSAPGDSNPGTFNTGHSKVFPFVSNFVTVKVPSGEDPTMQFQGPSRILVKIYAHGPTPSSPSRELIQTIELSFPAAEFPIPELKTVGTATTTAENWWTFGKQGIIAGKPGRLERVGESPVPTAGNNDNGSLIWPEDTLRTLVPYHGDIRLVAGAHHVPSGVFQPFAGYFDTRRSPASYTSSNTVRIDINNPYPQIKNQLLGSAASHYDAEKGIFLPAGSLNLGLVEGANYSASKFPKFPIISPSSGAEHSARNFQKFGDFDNGVATTFDGSYINKPDDGNNFRGGGSDTPYFSSNWMQAAGGPTFFSPNRQVPGPGMFGSLPTNLVSGNQPFVNTSQNIQNTWRTLLLRPQPDHPGAGNPPDHLWLDFFWMPVVEPYAISTPFSTAGKINMNYAVEPFSYIRRATGMVALLRSEKFLAIPKASASTYKNGGSSGFRVPINSAETLKQFEATFKGGKVFLSPSQICDIHLIPPGQSLNADGSNATSVMKAYWELNALTGDNSRERPYTNLQGRLTTKSNTFTIHYRVQTLKKRPAGNANIWDESKDQVTSELRGSETIERYINPNDASIPDYASIFSSNPAAQPEDLGKFYKWRTVSTRKFAP